MKDSHIQQGKDAEAACCQFLKTQGLQLICKNFHSRYGEIDLIMSDNETLVFVEVRYRKNNLYGGGLESVNYSKQQKLRKTAELYLQRHDPNKNARFDVVSMSIRSQQQTKLIKNRLFSHTNYDFNWVTNAF